MENRVINNCADCGVNIGEDNGPVDGWKLEDGRIVCHKCCAKDTKEIARQMTDCIQRIVNINAKQTEKIRE